MKSLFIFGLLVAFALSEPTMYKKNEHNMYEAGEFKKPLTCVILFVPVSIIKKTIAFGSSDIVHI
jgi:hypothetical protein